MAGFNIIDESRVGFFYKQMRLFLCCLSISLFTCSQPQTTFTPSKVTIEVTAERLAQVSWIETPRMIGDTLKFNSDGTFRHHISFEGCASSSGKYRIKNGQITFLKVTTIDACMPWFTDNTVCKLVETQNDVDYEEYLKCNNKSNEPSAFEYANQSRRRRKGDSITLNKMKAIVLGAETAEISENVVFRKAPSASAERVLYRESIDCSNGGRDEQSYIPKGHKIKLLARSEERFKVQKWENHWYYICPVTCEVYLGEGCYFRGWVFGEFIKN